MISNRRRSTAAATLLAALVLLPFLGHKLLAEWDEAIYAGVSLEMLRTGWLTPHWNAHLWLEKPPLELWLTAGFFRLFGPSEFWARACSAWAAIALVAVLHEWLFRTRDALTAWLSTLILVGTLGFLHVAHVGETDTLLALGATLALIALTKLSTGSTRIRPWLLLAVGLSIAVMTKGAAAVPLLLTVLFIARQRLFTSAAAISVALFAGLILPWHWLMFHRFGQRFLDQYLGLHVLTRATRQIEGHNTHWWYYLVVLLVSAPPFCLLYLPATYSGLRSKSRPNLRPFAIFALVELVFFSVVQTRLPHYIAPAYPAFAVLTAVLLANWIRPRLIAPRVFWLRTLLAAAALAVITIAATHPALKGLHSAALAGPNLLDNKEADTLLLQAHLDQSPAPGPLLYWRDGRVQSIASVVFYARRAVQQIELAPIGDTPRNIYIFDPQTLDQAVTTQPHLILLDKSLTPKIPPRFLFTSILTSPHLTLGTIRLMPM